MASLKKKEKILWRLLPRSLRIGQAAFQERFALPDESAAPKALRSFAALQDLAEVRGPFGVAAASWSVRLRRTTAGERVTQRSAVTAFKPEVSRPQARSMIRRYNHRIDSSR
jgi:hypothetical protein